jgi:type IV secretion system protein VirD4
LTRLLRPWLPLTEYPLAVVDVSAPDRRFAAGYPQVRWSPILGCLDYTVAYRRAVALVNGIDTGQTRGSTSDNDQFFRDSAGEVLAAWLHAADLTGKDVDDLAEWLRRTDNPTATRILRDDPRAEPSAAVNITRHLDPTAGRTTSGVLRYLTLALNSLTATEGRQICGTRDDSQFDMEHMITAGGTVYVLADASRVGRIKPLPSLLAGEMFLAADAVALRNSRRRLPQPFIGVIDELRHGIIIPNLPYVASAQRKYGIGYVYGVQTASQEDVVYGSDAAALRAAAGVSIIGGIDIDSARDLSDRAGTTPVVAPTRSSPDETSPHGSPGGGYSEQLHHQDTLTVADQQHLGDGHAVVLARGLAPFLVFIPSYRDIRALNRTIGAEADTVTRHVTGARDRQAITGSHHSTAATAGADFTLPGRSS